MMSDAMEGEALAVAALVMFSTNIVLTKVASHRMNLNAGYLVSVGVNVLFAGSMFAVELLLRRTPLAWNWSGFGLFVAAGVFATYLGRWFNFEAIARMGAARASAFQASSPMFTLVVAWLFLGERLSAVAIGAMGLTILGLLLISLSPSTLARLRAVRGKRRLEPGMRSGQRAKWRVLLRVGAVLGFTSSAAYAIGNVFRGTAIRQWDEPILGALLGAIAGIALQYLIGPKLPDLLRELRASDRTAIALFATGGVLTIVAQVGVIAAMRHVPVAIVALITLCSPLLVFPMSYFLLHNQEGISSRTIIGAVLTLAGIAILILR